MSSYVISQEDFNLIVDYQSFRNIAITSELSNTGTIEFGINHQSVKQNSVSNIFLGSLDDNSEWNIHFEITVDQGIISSFTVIFLHRKDSKKYDFYVSSDNKNTKTLRIFNNIKIVYMRGSIIILILKLKI